MGKQIKRSKKVRGLTLQFMPYSEIAGLDSVARIKKLLKIILDNKVVILQGKLKTNTHSKFDSIIQNLKQQGAEVIILGCTDLQNVIDVTEGLILDSCQVLEDVVVSLMN